jgi:hypothetical protein
MTANQKVTLCPRARTAPIYPDCFQTLSVSRHRKANLNGDIHDVSQVGDCRA